VQRQGYKLTVAQFKAFAKRPTRLRPVRRKNPLTSYLGRLPDLSAIAGLGTTPGESMLRYLYRLEWVVVEGEGGEVKDGDRVAVTELGRAVLAALDEGSVEQEVPTTIVLDQDDPVAKGKLIGEIAGAGECALVDRFFSVDDLLTILQRTDVTRVLSGPTDKPKLAALEQALGDLEPSMPREFEIRTSNAFHDRFVIPTEGAVLQIGTSLTGVGKRLSVLVNMGDDAAAQAVRKAFEEAWSGADRLEPKPALTSQPKEVPGDEEAAKAEAEAAVEEAVAEVADEEQPSADGENGKATEAA
jgi:hypothetical protein